MKFSTKITLFLACAVVMLGSVLTLGVIKFWPDYVLAQNIKQSRVDEKELEKFILVLMEQARVTKLSESKKSILIKTLTRVSDKTFDNFEHKKWFATLIAIESRFDKDAKSPAGALGLAQVMERYATAFGQECGIPDIKGADLYDSEINLMIGACQFKTLLSEMDNNVAAALVAYNAGRNSKSLQQLKSLSNIKNEESANYVTRFIYVASRAENAAKGAVD